MNSSKPVLTVNGGGSGSIITGFIITGGTGLSSSGIRLNSATNCTIQSNSITGNRNGIYLSGLSTNNYIFNNYIQNSTFYGISLSSRNNTITGNNISNNNNGIMIDSHYNLISRNTLSNNRVYGIYMDGADNTYLYENTISYNNYGVYFFECTFEMHFNQIFGNQYGVYSDLGGILNATNNWWGTNNPTNTSTNIPADIVIYDGVVTYDPWLVLNMTGSVIHVTKNSSSSSQITVDLTHNNHGDDTSGSGTIPDGLPVNFTATVPATITSGATIKRGKATVILTSSTSSGATIVTATTYNQTFSKSFRKSFSTIQSAIEDALTVNGDVILVENGTYTENIVVDKRLGIFSEGNVTVQALNLSLPVFTVTGGGNSSVINGFHIIGATGSSGVYLSSASDCVIDSNSIEWNTNGVYLEDSTGNLITNNLIGHNVGGLNFYNSSSNTITSNYITDNEQGIFIPAECMEYFESISINNTISKNTIENNNYGICLMGDSTGINSLGRSFNDTSITENTITGNDYGVYVSSTAFNMHFNRISGNNVCGLWIETDAFLDVKNNWWGTNNPLSDHNTYNSSEVYDIFYNGGFDLYYSNEVLRAFAPWLVLTLNTSSVNSGGNASVTADLTHNNVGNDTSSEGHIPDDIPVTFTTNPGSVISPVYTFNGQATTILNLGTLQPVMVNVSASVDMFNVSEQVTSAPGMVILNINSTAVDPSTSHYEIMGYLNVTVTRAFNWYKLAVLMGGTDELRDYLGSQYGEMTLAESMPLPEALVKQLIYEHLYSDWWSEELLHEFVYSWGLDTDYGDYYYQYIQHNYLSWQVVDDLYTCMWDELGNCTVQNPPSNDRDDTVWYSRVWAAGNYPTFPGMLPYMPVCWTKSFAFSSPMCRYDPVNMSYSFPLNNSTAWVSVVWKDTQNSSGLFSGELDIIVNGAVVQSKQYFNEAYLNLHRFYRPIVFQAIIFANRVLSPDQEDVVIPSENRSIWDMLRDDLTESEVQFIRNYRTMFMDNLYLNLSYPGEAGKTITVSSSNNTTQNLTLNFGGNLIQRVSPIIYGNGAYIHNQTDPITNTTQLIGEPAGYEGVRSFAITTSMVTNETMDYWLSKQTLYAPGAMKAAYGTFLTSLLMIRCHDMVADSAASKYNVTWSRTHPIVVSAGDEAYNYYLTLECDHGMGMTVTGTVSSMRAFNYACSSAINSIEHWVMKSLFPNLNTSTSITMGLGQLLLDGETMEMFESNGYTVMRMLGNDTRILLIDPETGIVRDIMISEYGWINGAYCYYNLQTNMATDLGTGLGSFGQAIMNIFTNGNGIIDFSGMADNVKEGLIGFMSSAMISLQWAKMFLTNNIPSNLFSTFTGLGMVGLAVNNVFMNYREEQDASSRVILDSGNANPSFWMNLYPNSRISPISPNLYKVEINGTHTEWGWYIENKPYYYMVPIGAGDDFAVIYNPNNGYWDGSGYVKEGVPRWGPHPVTDWYEVTVIWYSDEKLTNPYLHP